MTLALAPAALASSTQMGAAAGTTASAAPSTTTAVRHAPLQRPFAAPERLVPGRVLLKLTGVDDKLLRRADAGETSARAVVDRAAHALPVPGGMALSYQRRLPAGWALFTVPTDDEDLTELVVEAIHKAPGVAGAATDRWLRPLRTPDDEFFDLMWHLQPIGAPGAWDITTGSTGQTIGVVDTGTFRSHEDLVGKDANGFDFVSNGGGNDGDARDNNYNDPGDGCGQTEDSFHGSHVAGTILANANNGSGIAGLNWNARLITARVLGCGGGDNVDIMEGLAWLAGFDIPLDPNNPNGGSVPALPAAQRPRVANLSLGGPGGCDDFSRDVLQAVLDQGTIPVVAAGNDSGVVNSPASCPAAIAVGAYGPGSDNPLAGYSSFGPEIAIVAPGGDQDASGRFEDGVLSFYSNAISPPYTFLEGTSMAAPHVTGSVSLMLSMNPSLSRAQIVGIFNSTGDFCRGCDGKPALRVDLAVAAAGSVSPTQPGDTCTSFCSPGQACVDSTCRTTCSTDTDCLTSEVCDATDGACIPGGGGGGGGTGGGGGGGGGVAGDCDPARGNMDCANGTGCVENPDSAGGKCIRGVDSGDRVGALCEDNIDCESGLCDRGVCTVTCDFDDGDCKDGFECDDNAAPGGLCRAESCKEESPSFCESGWECSFSSAERYVCADAPSNYSCASADLRGGPAPLALALALWSARRRVTRRRTTTA